MTDEDFLLLVKAEVERARYLFPGTKNMALAHAEEAGELTKAVLDYSYGKATADDVLNEAVQAAAMALRVALDGDTGTEWPGY